MSLLSGTTTPTSAQSAASRVDQIRATARENAVNEFNDIMDAIFYNPGANPQDVANCFAAGWAMWLSIQNTRNTVIPAMFAQVGLPAPGLRPLPDGVTVVQNGSNVTITVPTPSGD